MIDQALLTEIRKETEITIERTVAGLISDNLGHSIVQTNNQNQALYSLLKSALHIFCFVCFCFLFLIRHNCTMSSAKGGV